ncbi:MAG: hypothetical protein MAG431_00739 [Chloroflexi bacterium]|nr:hypothetical protein [Chloroflexota bacterium]
MKAIVVNYPPVVWTAILTLGGIYNAIVTQESEGYSWGQAVLTGLVTFVWPIVLISTLIR